MLAQKRMEREYLYERGEERGVGRIKLTNSTFYGRFDSEEYMQYERY